MGQLNHEPSMEDILASIKRIIAEDSEAVGARIPRPRRELSAVPNVTAPEPEEEPVADEPEAESADVLELTSPISPAAAAPESAETAAETSEAAMPASKQTIVSEEAASKEIEKTVDSAKPAEAAAAPAPTASEAIQAIDTLMSDPARQASRNAFASLSQLQIRPPVPAGENTLEGLVADMLRPMLREWLDRELPSLVERLVAAEIARVSGRS